MGLPIRLGRVAAGAAGGDFELCGGEGVDDEVFRGYRLVPLDERSGYREDDGFVHRHWWLGYGPGRLIFDPTVHQFDDRGGVSLDRYVIQGKPPSRR
jgi:uncharacterized protein YodC (DUF2158 family)